MGMSNDIYDLSNENLDEFEAKRYESGSWLANRLCPGKEVSWAVTKKNISMNDFAVEARIWLTIICR